MTSALAFLERILPAEGYKCATVFHEGKVWNRFFATCDDLAKFIGQQDALGRTVYHACAVFGTPDSRKQSNAIGAQSFWLDIDAGEGKPYAGAVEAALAVSQFTARTGLPPPIYVGSGNGLHIYWPLAEIVQPALWQKYARGLAAACRAAELAVDPSRTTDLASVLRTPGTHHRKGEPKLVRVGELPGPYDLSLFDCLLEGETNAIEHTRPVHLGAVRLSKPVGERSAVPSIISAAANIYADEPQYTEPVTRQCAQISALAIRHGKLPEPLWYAALGVLASCIDGDQYAHSWSSGYPGYTHAETQSRLDRSREFGPTTCGKFESLNPSGCAGCQYRGKLTSPIQLGKIRATAPRGIPDPVSGVRGELDEAPEKALPDLPEGYIWRGRALVLEGEKKEGVPSYEMISNFPVYLDAVQTGEVHDSHSLSMKLELPHEPAKTIIMPAKLMFSNSGMSEMAGAGVMVHNPDLFRKFVRDSVDKWNGAKKLERRYDQFGWKDEESAFLYGTNLYTASAVRPVIGSDEVQSRSQYLGPRRNGSIGGWSGAANQLFALGHEVQAFALLSSFAAPLMRFHSSGEGGAIVSLVSDKSGTGKTTALEAAASVWGRLKGTQIIDDDTTVAKGLKLAVFGNIACTYDELYNRDPEVIRRFVLMFTNGRDKDRGTADGTLRHVRSEWQTILLLASNNSIVDILSSMDGTDAPAYRVLEFLMDTPATMDKRRGDQLKQQLDANSGFAADLYLRTLLQPDTLKFIKASLPKWTDEIWNKTGLDKEHRFWVRTIASVIAAGTLVRHAGLLDFSVDRIAAWAIEQVKDKRRVHGELTGHRSPISMLVSFLDQHLLDTLVVPKAFKPGPNQTTHVLLEPRRNLLIRHELLEHRIYVEEQTLKKWLVKSGINTEGFYKELKDKGILGTVRRITLGAGTPHSTGQTTALEFIANHPAMSGHVAAVETIVTPAIKRA
jgi:Domain of unknown function (DUF927)